MPGDLSRLYSGRAGAPYRKTFLNMLDFTVMKSVFSSAVRRTGLYGGALNVGAAPVS